MVPFTEIAKIGMRLGEKMMIQFWIENLSNPRDIHLETRKNTWNIRADQNCNRSLFFIAKYIKDSLTDTYQLLLKYFEQWRMNDQFFLWTAKVIQKSFLIRCQNCLAPNLYLVILSLLLELFVTSPLSLPYLRRNLFLNVLFLGLKVTSSSFNCSK